MTVPSLRASVLALLLVVAARELHAQEDVDRGRIGALVARYDSLWRQRDTAAIRRLLDPRYQYFTSRGGIWSRDDVLRMAGSSSYVLARARRSEVVVTHRPPVAVVSSRWEGAGSYEGKPFTDDQRCGQVWLDVAGGWQLLSEHCVQIERAP